MSFEIKRGDLFANTEGHIVHGCNAQGVMGGGVAKIVRDMYPKAYEVYHRHCADGYARLGQVIPVCVAPNLIIHNAITQDKFGSDKVYVDYEAVRAALLAVEDYVEAAVQSEPSLSTDVHFPFIGAGLGGGDENRLLCIFEDVFGGSNISATLWLL
jgi:O-acetyl-ADP-ribose deacetylase (regulator of RNase III)